MSQFERLLEEAEADVAAGRVEDADQYMKRFKDKHNLSFSGDFVMTETVLRQVRDRLGPLSGEAEQAVAEALEIVRRMNGSPFSPTAAKESKDDDFKSENVSLDEYESWSDDQQLRYLTEAKKTNAKWIETRLQDLGAMWLMVCDGKVITHGPTLQTFPHEEEFDELCEKIGKFPFVIFSPRLFFIEETVPWHSTKMSGDAYPTIRFNLKTDGAETELEADFDTGALDTYFDLDLLMQRGVVKAKKRKIYDESSHLGKNYKYIAKSIRLELKDKNGQHRQIQILAARVKNWNSSPFVAINPNRTALVGRDTMLQLQPVVLLDFANRQTEVEYRQILTS